MCFTAGPDIMGTTSIRPNLASRNTIWGLEPQEMSFPDAVELETPARHLVRPQKLIGSVTSVVMTFLKQGGETGKYFACIVEVV